MMKPTDLSVINVFVLLVEFETVEERDEGWSRKMIKKLSLESTLRPRGRLRQAKKGS